jgi:hypothetical protein
MEFHPSYARAVVRASRFSEDPMSASTGAISSSASPKSAPVATLRPHWSPSRTRLINLERRAKFARAKFATTDREEL